jgi:uncharacterized cofD-like protein
MRTLKWVRIGFRFRKWLTGAIVGGLLLLLSFAVLLKDGVVGPIQKWFAIVTAAAGLLSIGFCFRTILMKFLHVYPTGIYRRPQNMEEVGDVLYRRKLLSTGPHIVVIGGGTGISTMLRGLKRFSSNITAVITVADDGGGSGVLREDLGMLPPGDIRNCIMALAETESVMERLLQYRFSEGRLKGQSFGNLFLAAMNGISENFEQAVRNTGDVLAVTGRVLPVTEQDVRLVALLEDGTTVEGESLIGSHHQVHPGRIEHIRLNPADAVPLPPVLDAIKTADLIVLGPGSLYTSILPNLLVDGVSQAIRQSKAARVYVCNVMTQPGETDGFTVSDHVQALSKHVGEDLFDYCLVNCGEVDPPLLERYRDDGADLVMVDLSRLKKMGIKVVESDVVEVRDRFVRHDPDKLAQAVMDILRIH